MRTIAFAVLSVLAAVPALAAGRQIGTYVYDGSGNVKSILGEPYRYDAFGRLVRATVEGQEQVVAYDRYGNISSIHLAGGSEITLGVDPATNRLTDDTKNVFATYDGAGRLTAELGGAGNTFTYDSLDSVTRSRVDGTGEVHLYAANDERVASVTVLSDGEGSSEWTLRDEAGRVRRRLRKSGTAWNWERDYIHGAGGIVAAEVVTGQTLHFFPDHLRTPRLITGNGGTRVALHTYFPFGDEITEAAQDDEKLKFTGHERDGQSLDYMHARYYNPRWGRFLSVDPGGFEPKRPQSWNRYVYASNNPINRFDLDGREDLRSALDVAMLEDFDTLAMTGEAMAKTNLGANMLSERREHGLIITSLGGGDYGAEGPYTSGKTTEVGFPLLRTGQTITSPSGQPVAGTIHTHPGTGFLRASPGANIQTVASGASAGDRNLASVSRAPAFVIQPNDAIIRVDPNTQRPVRVLTEADFTAYLRRAETARQAKQFLDLLSLLRF